MQTLTHGYRGMRVMMTLSWDRILTTGAVIGALYAGAYVALILPV